MFLDNHHRIVATADGLKRCLPILVLLHLFLCHRIAVFAPFEYLFVKLGGLAEFVIMAAPRTKLRVRQLAHLEFVLNYIVPLDVLEGRVKR